MEEARRDMLAVWEVMNYIVEIYSQSQWYPGKPSWYRIK